MPGNNQNVYTNNDQQLPEFDITTPADMVPIRLLEGWLPRWCPPRTLDGGLAGISGV